MTIDIQNKTERINLIIERANREETDTLTFKTLMNSLSKMAVDAKASAFTYPPMPRFEYNTTIFSELVDILSPEEKSMLEEVGIEFRKQAGSFTRVYMFFAPKS